MTRFEKFSVAAGLLFIALVLVVSFGSGRSFLKSIGLSLFAPISTPELPIVCGNVSVLNEPYLSNPTSNQVTLSLRLGNPGTMWVETASDANTWTATAMQSIPRDVRADFILSLTPNTEYQYRVGCTNPNTGTAEYWFQNSFHTIPSPGSPVAFRFVYLTDTHYYQQYAKDQNGEPSGIQAIRKTIENITSWNPLFTVFGGDWRMTHCTSCPRANVDGEDAGVNTAKTVREAELRSRQSIREFKNLLARSPMVPYNGNHEGENGFMQAVGVAKCNYRLNTDAINYTARLKYLPNVSDTYSLGDSTGNYYSFEVGPAQFTIIDVMKYQPLLPQTASNWTIGATQGNWFANTLLGNSASRKFVFAEHLAGGGAGGPPNCNGEYWYGRGQLKSKVSGTTLGPFIGQQEELNQVMKQAGGAIWFSGHDHLAMFGEDLDVDGAPTGNYYILGGRGGDTLPGWAADPGVISQYDYNGNGEADYNEVVDYASNKAGFWLVDVLANGDTILQYIATDMNDATLNNQPVITKFIQG